MGAAILRVGLTGNIAAGKSTVAGWLAELGCRVLDLDVLGHACLEADTPTHARIVEQFGEEVLAADGAIDRRALGALVFDDEAARARLEAVLHPAIRAAEEERAAEIAAAEGSSIVVSEAALLFETGGAARYHRMVVVTAPDEERRRRLRERGLSDDEISARMAAQMDQERKAALADYVVDNGGTRAASHEQTRELAGKLRRDLVRLSAGQALEQAAADDSS